jgi:CRP/FNR family transcriptional regulator, cyclic AMP receptor protein
LPLEDKFQRGIIRTRMIQNRMANDIFDQLAIFAGLTKEQRKELMPLFTPCDYYPDSLIFEQGVPAEFLYVVVVGEVVVNFKPDDGPPLTVARVKPGGVVGWSAALGTRVYTSGAMCVTYSQMLRVRGTDLRRLCENHPETGNLILNRLAEVIAQRISNTHEQVLALLEIGLRSSLSGTGD